MEGGRRRKRARTTQDVSFGPQVCVFYKISSNMYILIVIYNYTINEVLFALSAVYSSRHSFDSRVVLSAASLDLPLHNFVVQSPWAVFIFDGPYRVTSQCVRICQLILRRTFIL
jgi:hypothetical protein